jgi:hypothetical protein
MTEARRQMVKLVVSPFLYFTGAVPAVVGVMAAFASIDYGGILYRYVEPLYRYDYLTPSVDEIGLALILVIGGLAFGIVGWALIVFEGARRPKLTDHLRRCACFYVFFAILSAELVQESVRSYQMPGYPPPEFQVQVLWLLAGCAILVDSFVLVWQRRRYDRLALGVEL